MESRFHSRSTTPSSSSSSPNRAYQTTYRREFILKNSSPIVEGIPFGQRFLIGSPFQLSDSIGHSLYRMDFTKQKNALQEPFFRPNTTRANRPHPHKGFPYWPRQSESLLDLQSQETKQTLRNQLNSTYQVDYTGSCQGFDIPLAYERSQPFWRDQAKHTLDSEYRHAYQTVDKEAMHRKGRYAFSNRKAADAIVPQTLPVWKTNNLQSIYGYEISAKNPTGEFMKEFVDSLSGSMA